MNEIIESNKLIAEFMGVKVNWVSSNYFDTDGDWNIELDFLPEIMQESELNRLATCDNPMDNLNFHDRWDWLVPVINKIIEIDITPAPNWTGYRVEIIPRGYVSISGFPMDKIVTNISKEGSLITATYKAVIEFIKYYNRKHNP
ncbi:MAG: hypothetical protein WC055_01860 [Melioribacteraceae bacterium]